MTRCDFVDRIELRNGELVRIIKAVARTKKDNGKSLDVYEEYENGKAVCRNLYYSMTGYVVGFPNETNSLYKNGSCSFFQPLDEYGECDLPTFFYYSRYLNDEEKALVESAYPDFKYCLKKWKGTIAETLCALRFWKKHKEIEFLLAAGFKRIALSKSFWKLSAKKKKEVVKYLRTNDCGNVSLSEVQISLKYQLSKNELEEYLEFCGHFGKIKYDVFRYLEKCGLDDYNGVELYRDYLRLLKQTTHSKTESYWRFPKNLAQKHNELLREVEHYNLLKESEKLKAKQKRYFESVKKLLKYKMNIDGYCVYVPETVEDISFQAKALHQCLVQCDYISKVINGECVLVFIRKDDCPVATAQLLKGNKIGQFYANELDRSKCLPTDEVRAVMNKWIELKKAA